MKIIDTNYKENKQIVLQKLSEYYSEQAEHSSEQFEETNFGAETDKPVSFVLQNEETILGRILGKIDYITSSIRIEDLIVEKESRGTGAGRLLVEKIEEVGRMENCQMSFVDTTSSSAPKFYEKLGYSLIGEIKDYPMPNEIYYLYMKRLD